MKLVQLLGWRYLGYGRVVRIKPTAVDFGLFSFEVGPPTNNSRCVGEHVQVKIDDSRRFLKSH